MDIVKARKNIFKHITNEFSDDFGDLFIEDQVSKPDLTKNYTKINYQVLDFQRQSIGTVYSDKVMVSLNANIFTILNGGDKIGIIEHFTTIIRKGISGLVLDGNLSTQYLNITSTHEVTRIIAYFYFIQQTRTINT